MNIQRRLLIFGKTAVLSQLAATLRTSPLLQVVERKTTAGLGELHPDMVVVDAAQVTPEQFHHLIPLCATILSLDPDSYQLTVLSSPPQADLAKTAWVIERLALIWQSPADRQDLSHTGA